MCRFAAMNLMPHGYGLPCGNKKEDSHTDNNNAQYSVEESRTWPTGIGNNRFGTARGEEPFPIKQCS